MILHQIPPRAASFQPINITRRMKILALSWREGFPDRVCPVLWNGVAACGAWHAGTASAGPRYVAGASPWPPWVMFANDAGIVTARTFGHWRGILVCWRRFHVHDAVCGIEHIRVVPE